MNFTLNKRILPHYLESAASLRAGHSALIDADRVVTYGNLRDHVLKVAAYLSDRGVGRGDRVALMLPNSIEFVISFWAIQYLGAVAVPLNPDIKATKLNRIISDCTPAALILHRSLRQRVDTIRVSRALPAEVLWNCGPCEPSDITLADIIENVDPVWQWAPELVAIDQDLACIIYTSGSTGVPKGVMLSHLNMICASSSVAEYLALLDNDRIFCALPFSFDYGLYQSIMSALVGATLIVEESFSQPLFSLHRVVKQGATVFPIVPMMVHLIEPLARRFDFTCVRTVTSTAAVLHPHAIDKLQCIFSGARIFSMYGLTECHRCSYLDPADLVKRKDSVGKAIPNTEFWVVDEAGKRRDRGATGELVIRGSTIMKGYWNNHAATEEVLKPGPLAGERVFYTGDICRIDDEGYLYFVSRKDDVLKVRGEKVPPKEVEAALMHHPAVTEAAVIGIPHSEMGDMIIAFVVTLDGANLTSAAIKAWCMEQVEAVMVPSRIVILESLPRSPNGKIDKHALKEKITLSGDFTEFRVLPSSGEFD